MQPLTAAQLRGTWANALDLEWRLRRVARRAVPELFEELPPCDA